MAHTLPIGTVDHPNYNGGIPMIMKAFVSDRNGAPAMIEPCPLTISDIAAPKDFVDGVRRHGVEGAIDVMRS